MNRQLETLESRYCLSSPVQMHGGDFVGHQRQEFRVASFTAGGMTTVATAKVDQIAMETKALFAWSAQTEARRFEWREGYARGGNVRVGGGAMNRADGPSVNANYAGPAGHYYTPSPFIFIHILPGNGEAIVFPGGEIVASPATGGEVTGAGSVAANSGQVTKPKPARHVVDTETDTTPVNDQEAAAVTEAVTDVRRVLARAAQTLVARAADLFAAAEPVAARGPILASASSPLAARAADFAVAAVQTLATQWNEGASVAQIARSLAGRLRPVADAVINAPLVTSAANAAAPVIETLAFAMSTPAAAVSYDIVHLGSPFMLLADSVASFVEESAAVPNVLAQAKSSKPWGLTFTVLAADLAVVSYVYRRKKALRRGALAPVAA